MKPIKPICSLLLALLLLAACDGRTAQSSVVPEDASSLSVEVVDAPAESILEQMDALYEQMDNTPLPLKGADAYTALGSFDGGTQLVKDDETAKKLASAIYDLLDAYGNGLGTYTGADDLSMARTTLALFHTAPADFSWEVGREGEFSCGRPEHVVAALVKRELDAGRTPVAVYDAAEVHKTARRLFGETARITDMDEPPYYYYKKEGVYLLMEELGKGQSVPQILSYEKTADGYKAEAVLVERTENGLQYGGQALTKENFAQATVEAQHLRYTFREESGSLVLVSLETWRPGRE